MRLPVLQAALLVCSLAGCAQHHEATIARADTREYDALYGKPLTSLGAKYAQLTAAAKATVLAEAGSAQIYDIVKDRRGGRVFFVVYFMASAAFPPLYIAPDGSVLRPDLSVLVAAPKDVTEALSVLVTPNDLPPETQKVLQERAGGAEVAAIYKEAWGDHTVYVVTFKDEAHHPRLQIPAEGAVFYSAPKQ